MKNIIVILFVISIVFANDPTQKYDQCINNCCKNQNGELIDGFCELEKYEDYDRCVDQCADELYSEMDYSCCGPAFLLIGLLIFSFKKR